MLSLKNGGVAPARSKASLLGLMTPNLRSLFEGTVEPLLDLLRFRDELRQKEQARGRWENARARNTRKLERERATLAQMAEGGAGQQYTRQQGMVSYLQKLVRDESKKLENAAAAAKKLKSKVAAISKRKAVGPALAKLEAPVVDNNDGEGEGAAPASAVAASASAASASSSASSSSSAGAAAAPCNSKPSAPPVKKARKGGSIKKTTTQQHQHQQPDPSWLLELLTQHTDCASVVLDFLGGGSALRGIGATSPALRAEIKASLPRLALRIGNSPPPCAGWGEFSRLQHLTICGWATKEQHQQVAASMAEVGLNARLQSFSYDHSHSDVYEPLLARHDWPQLRSLSCGRFGLTNFLDAVLAQPAAVFPRLASFQVDTLHGHSARKLLTLMDRGALPALTSIGRSTMAQGSAADTAQQVALLRRLPAMEAVTLHVDVAPFAGLISNGSLPNLKSLRFTCDPSTPGHDPTSLFNALGSGALTRLHTLDIGRAYVDAYAVALGAADPPVLPNVADILPNSLPSLHKLAIDAAMPAGLLGGILAAAGPGLHTLHITHGRTATAAMRLLEESAYVWAPALRSLSLHWGRAYYGYGAQPVDLDSPRCAIDALARLPALESLALHVHTREPDELVVRLLALAEAGGLSPSLATLHLDGREWTAGAVLLLLLWLKRETKKALEGEGAGVLWEVKGLTSEHMHDSMKQITETHLFQLAQARKLIRKARAAAPGVV